LLSTLLRAIPEHRGTRSFSLLALWHTRFSPIDLIPDFVPVLGYLDDLILIPIGIALAIRMVPSSVLAECRARAQEVMSQGKPVNRIAGAVIVVIWIALTALFAVWAYETFVSARASP
jgi:hypothetical protein